MANHPSPETNKTSAEPPKPEVLKPQADTTSSTPPVGSGGASSPTKTLVRPRHATYRPSHKATFIGLAVVIAILAINVAVIAFVMKSQGDEEAQAEQGAVTLSSGVLNTLGVSRNTIGDTGAELVVGPNSKFNGNVTIGSDVSIAGELRLNSKFSASDASLAKLEAGDTSLGQLNVNGDGTLSNLNLRNDLSVVGLTRLQGPVTVSQLLTVNNSLNVAGNMAVGGVLSARGFQASSLVSDTTLTIGGHIITRGPAPGVSAGSAVGANGTVSISGNDASGTVAVNAGTNAGGGIVAFVSFRSQYSGTPHVVVTAVGPGAGSVYINRNASGFSIGVNGALTTGGHAFDYIVMQ